jgi:MFS transporter, PPP family, 3-phenylpropionic acid transporter
LIDVATRHGTGEARSNPERPLGSFIVLYAALYAAFGVASPFLPAFIEGRGIAHEQIGLIFATGTAVRLLSAPLVARLADRRQALRLALSICAVATATAALGYLFAWSFWTIFAVSLLHAIALAPLSNLADALALVASKGGPGRAGFEYGWVRGAGSAAFILALVSSGYVVAAQGLTTILVLQALLMLAVPLAVASVPPVTARPAETSAEISRASIVALLRLPEFRRIVLVSALILGSHAMHDIFAVIRWSAAGVPPQTASLLWSLAVGGEVIVFFLVGPWLVRVMTPAGAIILAALAGAARWIVEAFTAEIAALVLIQPLHGFTFALLHLACMRLLANIVPTHLAATAQAIYGTVGAGLATTLLALASGWLYARLGPLAFLVMSALCVVAVPVAASLRKAEE